MTFLSLLRQAYDADTTLTLRAPTVVQPGLLRVDCPISFLAAVQGFGLRPDTQLPLRIAGAPFFLSGVKRPGQPWVLRLRGRFEPAR